MDMLGKTGNLLTLRTLMPTHVQRLADNNFVNLVFFSKTAQRLEVGFHVLSTNGRAGLGRQQQRIADGNSNGFVANIKSHNPHIFMIAPVVTEL